MTKCSVYRFAGAAYSVAECDPNARWIWALSAPANNATSRIAQAAAARAMVFLAFWLMVSGWALEDFPVGLAAVAGATWISLRFLPPTESRPRVAPLAA